jgi:DNA-binding PadR family transcriptional regulator
MANFTDQQRQFLHAFYEIANQKAPDDLVDIHEIGQKCGFNDSQSVENVDLLTAEGFLESKGLPSSYRLTPKGRHEVRQILSGSEGKSGLAPRVTVNLVTFGDDDSAPEGTTPSRVGAQDCEAVANALDLVRQHVAKIDPSSGYARDHLLDVVRELEGELQQANPNRVRLQGLLLGLAIAAHLDKHSTDADHAVKVALSFLGVDVF